MNALHLERCASDEWAETVKGRIIPWVLEGAELGDDVIEIGPGPGRTTDILCGLAPHVTAVELDEDLAAKLAARFAGSNVEVIQADATAIPLPDNRFSAALSFTMLHHVPTPELQDRIFSELARVLRPGGMLAGIDSRDRPEFRELHEDDICVPIDPETLPARLAAAGFENIDVSTSRTRTRFRATKPVR
jgi:SAM-dependent methyltransferase